MRDFGTLLRRLQRLISVALLFAVIPATAFLNQVTELKIPKSQRTRVNRSTRHRQLPGISHAAGVIQVKIRGSASPAGAATLVRIEIPTTDFLTCEFVTSHTPEIPRASRTVRVALPRPPPTVS